MADAAKAVSPPPHPTDGVVARKRQYLSSLSQEQLIDICLKLDEHVASDAQASIWPEDLAATTAAGLTTPVRSPSVVPEPTVALAEAPTSPRPAETPSYIQQDPLLRPTSTTSEQQTSTPLNDPPQVAQSTEAPTSSETPATPGATPAQPTAPQSPPIPNPYPAAPHMPYGHQPYGTYPPHPGAYYPPPPGYSHYASSPSQNPHHQPYTPYPASGTTSYMASYPYNAHGQAQYPPPPPPVQPEAGQGPRAGSDDLPSYEEMIVEALEACADPEGAPPKNMFIWMQAQYPTLHPNFRPSASQALQKALKRGRLEKNELGKYRLNRSWSGGTSSKRSRRPHAASAAEQANRPSTPKSAPAAPRPPTSMPAGGQHQPYGASSGTFAYGAGGWGGSGAQSYLAVATSTASLPVSAPPPTAPAVQDTLAHTRAAIPPGVAPDDWGAAARQVFELLTGTKPEDAAGAAPAPPDGAGVNGEAGPSSVPAVAPVAEVGGGEAETQAKAGEATLSEHDRAALQAQLSLIAASLADFGQMEEVEEEEEEEDEYDEDDRDAEGIREEEEEEEEGVAPPATAATWAGAQNDSKDSPMTAREEEDDEDEDEDMDMEEVLVPTRTS